MSSTAVDNFSCSFFYDLLSYLLGPFFTTTVVLFSPGSPLFQRIVVDMEVKFMSPRIVSGAVILGACEEFSEVRVSKVFCRRGCFLNRKRLGALGNVVSDRWRCRQKKNSVSSGFAHTHVVLHTHALQSTSLRPHCQVPRIFRPVVMSGLAVPSPRLELGPPATLGLWKTSEVVDESRVLTVEHKLQKSLKEDEEQQNVT